MDLANPFAMNGRKQVYSFGFMVYKSVRYT